MAQKDKDDNDDSRYLVGAVPEVDGKVVFSKEFSKIYGIKKLPQLPENVKMNTTQIPGNINGAIILRITRNVVAPSTLAASSNSTGIVFIKLCISQIPYGKEDAVKNRITPPIVS